MSRDDDLTQYTGGAYRGEWAALEMKDRRRIMRAVNRARSLEDPHEARLAVGAARGQQRFWRWSWLVAVPIGLLQYRQGAQVMLLNLALALIMLGGMSWFFRRRAQRAERLNLEVWQASRGRRGGAEDEASGSAGSSRPHYDEWRPDPNTSRAKAKRRKKRR